MEGGMKVGIGMIKSKGLARLFGRMGGSIMGFGRMASNMEWGFMYR